MCIFICMYVCNYVCMCIFVCGPVPQFESYRFTIHYILGFHAYYNLLQNIIIYFKNIKMHYTVLLILNVGLGLDSMPDDRILVSRPGDQSLGLGLET